jgi:serine/threonine-protein kinase
MVTINVGRPRAVIPRGLIGLDVDRVTKTLRQAGFTNVTTEKAPSDAGVQPGQVLSLAPAGGRTVRLGQHITVTYAGGAARPPQMTPPSVTTSRESRQDTSSNNSPGRLARQGDDSAAAGSDETEGGSTAKKPGKPKGKGASGHEVGAWIQVDPRSLLPLDPNDLT